MQLLSLKLHRTYKGLKDQYFDFSNTSGNIIALIGLNGSGKSQLLELMAETFAYLERWQRTDFRTRTSLGFGVTVTYKCNTSRDSALLAYHDTLFSNVTTIRVTIKLDGDVGLEVWDGSDWEHLLGEKDFPLPYVVGYSSGLNENLQRSFMKNSVQYFEVMRTRLKRKKELSSELNDEQISEINQRYLKRNPHIFEPEEEYLTTNSGERITTEDGTPIEVNNYLLGLRESDTPASKCVFLDYDSAGLFLLSLAILKKAEISSILNEVTYKYPTKAILRYDLRRDVSGVDTVRDIQMLVSIAGDGNIKGIGKRTTDKIFDIYELDYLAGDITLDFTNDELIDRLREKNYNDPISLFNRLFKIQQLGVANWQSIIRQQLRKDNFIGTVKKPLKTKLPLSILDLSLADDSGKEVSFDDLSDGEAQLLQVLVASRLFAEQNTLFLFDEPETHLNPSWRTHFHRQLSKAIASQEGNESQSQVFLSTHSPFMVSSLKRESVMFFERNESGQIRMEPVENQTYGASFDVLIKEHFDLQSLISQTVVKDIKAHLPKGDTPAEREESKQWIMENVGESMEKAYLIRKLQS
ncbi:AAA family ATPase [Enterovibrio norvegicus]|uniref:AAA family ATPase n=1 Tax=Enterovibrio norvegicus TaxID=188144 RepID=UPI00352C8888